MSKIRIAHLAGPNATIQNTPPLVTSNKARARHKLAPMTDADGRPVRYDVLRPQKLAAPAVVYVEQFSAHPLESDASDLYAPPDGYLTADGAFVERRVSPSDRPVYRIEIDPQDGYYPLPYMARRADGGAWETDGISARASRSESRQPFMPDGSRLFEEIDRLSIGPDGRGNMISRVADVDFFRVAPSGGYLKGRQGAGEGTADIGPEHPGQDFFPYRPPHLNASPLRSTLARITNTTQQILSSGRYDGAIWTQGSPRIEETLYWFNLAIDAAIPICGNASHRYHGQIGNDGPQNIVDSVEYIRSKIWAGPDGRDRAGVVMIEDQRIYASREVMKVDARPGGFAVTGGHGGVLGGFGGRGIGAVLRYVPVTRHTLASEVNVKRLPHETQGLIAANGRVNHVAVPIKDAAGSILETAIPQVAIVKDMSYGEDSEDRSALVVQVDAVVRYNLAHAPLAGFVLEGLCPYGKAAAMSCTRALEVAAYSGFPVVNVGRGNTEGFAWPGAPFIGGSNLTATKARMLLMLCVMKFGMLPPASDPTRPTAEEKQRTEKAVGQFQAIFDTH